LTVKIQAFANQPEDRRRFVGAGFLFFGLGSLVPLSVFGGGLTRDKPDKACLRFNGLRLIGFSALDCFSVLGITGFPMGLDIRA
jgi:hypothetical protein